MPTFTGTLNPNMIFASLFNMIISQQVFANPIGGASSVLVDQARVDGTMYGDQKLYYSTDILSTNAFGGDAEAMNLLEIHRPPAPEQQAITMNVFRQIRVTVDFFLTKQAWTDETAFIAFNDVTLQWIRNTKRVYDITTYNTYIGVAQTEIGKQTKEITLPALPTTTTQGDSEAANRLDAQTIAKEIANLFDDLADPNRDYNDYGFMRAWDRNELVVVWNNDQVNKITYIDLPTIFNGVGIQKFVDYRINHRYFGNINGSGGTVPGTNTTIRSLKEKDYTVSSVKYHLFPGDLLPAGATYEADETYTEDNTILCKVMHRQSVQYMSGFEAGTSFFNSRSLTENHYLTFGHNTLEYLAEYPFITVKLKREEA